MLYERDYRAEEIQPERGSLNADEGVEEDVRPTRFTDYDPEVVASGTKLIPDDNVSPRDNVSLTDNAQLAGKITPAGSALTAATVPSTDNAPTADGNSPADNKIDDHRLGSLFSGSIKINGLAEDVGYPEAEIKMMIHIGDLKVELPKQVVDQLDWGKQRKVRFSTSITAGKHSAATLASGTSLKQAMVEMKRTKIWLAKWKDQGDQHPHKSVAHQISQADMNVLTSEENERLIQPARLRDRKMMAGIKQEKEQGEHSMTRTVVRKPTTTTKTKKAGQGAGRSSTMDAKTHKPTAAKKTATASRTCK